MIELLLTSRAKQIPLGFQQNPKKSLDQKLTPTNSHAIFLTLNDIHESNSSYVEKGCPPKKHMPQSSKVIWDMINMLSS